MPDSLSYSEGSLALAAPGSPLPFDYKFECNCGFKIYWLSWVTRVSTVLVAMEAMAEVRAEDRSSTVSLGWLDEPSSSVS